MGLYEDNGILSAGTSDSSSSNVTEAGPVICFCGTWSDIHAAVTQTVCKTWGRCRRTLL